MYKQVGFSSDLVSNNMIFIQAANERQSPQIFANEKIGNILDVFTNSLPTWLKLQATSTGLPHGLPLANKSLTNILFAGVILRIFAVIGVHLRFGFIKLTDEEAG